MPSAIAFPSFRSRWKGICPCVAQVFAIAIFTTVAASQTAQNPYSEEAPSTIRGTVVNSVTHMPIPRALVFTPGNEFAMLTDAEGHFEFSLAKSISSMGGSVDNRSLHFSPTTLMARKPGFLDDSSGSSQVEAAPGLEIEIPLTPEAIIKGRILSSETDPSPAVNVRLYSREVQDGFPKWLPGRTAQTNSSGEFRFAELRPGSYKLASSESLDNDPAGFAPGGQRYGFPPVYFPGVADFGSAATIQVAAGQTIEADIQLKREPYYPVKIAVANADAVARSLNVSLSIQGRRAPEYSLGYNSEKQEIEGMLPNGNYTVEASNFDTNSSLSGTAHLRVSGGPAEGSTMTLTPVSSIPVHVTEQFAEAQAGSAVTTVFSAPGGARTLAISGPRTYLNLNAQPADDIAGPGGSLRPPTGANDDSLVLQGLMPGRYWLHVNSNRGYVAAATMGGVDLLREPLVISPGSSAPIEIVVRDDTAELEGTVSGAGAHPAINDSAIRIGPPRSTGWVYCVPAPDSIGQFQQAWISPEGKFTASNLAPGNYRVFAFKSQQMNFPYRDPEAMKAYDSKGQAVHLAPGQKASVQLQLIKESD